MEAIAARQDYLKRTNCKVRTRVIDEDPSERLAGDYADLLDVVEQPNGCSRDGEQTCDLSERQRRPLTDASIDVHAGNGCHVAARLGQALTEPTAHT